MILKINDRIRNRRVELFSRIALNLRYDSIASAFSFSGYFDPNNAEHKDLYCIGHYHICTLEHNGELLFTGNMLSQGFSDQNVRELVSVGGYSLPGVLEDCQIPVSLYPLQSDGLSLREIAQKLIRPFGLSMIVDSVVSKEMDEVFESTTAEASGTIKEYLTSLANQKNIVISHNPKGNLVFTRAKTGGKPILTFDTQDENSIPFTKMATSFNGQGMHSDITVLKEPDTDGGNSGEFTIKNPYVINSVYRPKVIIQNSGTDIDTEKAARMALSAELKNLKLVITTDRWEVDGKCIKPNSLITVRNPKIYLYKKSTWFIEEISLEGDNKSMVATLTCCLPEVYNDRTPEYLFKGINLH